MSWRERSFSAPIRYTPATQPAAKGLLDGHLVEPAASAVLVFHGMGQQVRFETLSDLATKEKLMPRMYMRRIGLL
jgi:hypothetical protein